MAVCGRARIATVLASTENLKLADTMLPAPMLYALRGQHSQQACINGAFNINSCHVLASADVDAVVLRIAWNGSCGNLVASVHI